MCHVESVLFPRWVLFFSWTILHLAAVYEPPVKQSSLNWVYRESKENNLLFMKNYLYSSVVENEDGFLKLTSAQFEWKFGYLRRVECITCESSRENVSILQLMFLSDYSILVFKYCDKTRILRDWTRECDAAVKSRVTSVKARSVQRCGYTLLLTSWVCLSVICVCISKRSSNPRY